MIELKPCPFCGSTKLDEGKKYIQCPECGAQCGWVDDYTDYENVKQAWNTRAATNENDDLTTAYMLGFEKGKDSQDAIIRRLVGALKDIIKDAPHEPPEDYGYTGNADDSRDYGYNSQHYHDAKIAREALDSLPEKFKK